VNHKKKKDILKVELGETSQSFEKRKASPLGGNCRWKGLSICKKSP